MDWPIVSLDTVEGEHGEGGPGHGCLYEEPGGDVEVSALRDGEQPRQECPPTGGQAQPQLEEGEVLRHQSVALLPVVVDLSEQEEYINVKQLLLPSKNSPRRTSVYRRPVKPGI